MRSAREFRSRVTRNARMSHDTRGVSMIVRSSAMHQTTIVPDDYIPGVLLVLVGSRGLAGKRQQVV